MASNEPGWAVELLGEPIDVNFLRKMMPRSLGDCPWIEGYPGSGKPQALLRSPPWAELGEAREVFGDARRILDGLFGQALLHHADAERVRPGGVIKFGSDGMRGFSLIAEPGSYAISGGRGELSWSGEPQQPDAETELQKWFREAEADDALADLF